MKVIDLYVEMLMNGEVERLSDLLKKIRGDRPQRQFAKHLEVSFAAVRSWEEGESYPTLKNLEKIARVTGMTLQELLAYLKGDLETEQIPPKVKIAEDLLPLVNDLPREQRKRLIQILVAKD